MHSVKPSPEFRVELEKLEEKAAKGNGEAKRLLTLVNKGTAKINAKITAGIKIPRKLWPKEYVRKYGLNNLWKLNLDSYWRMLYTITGDQAELIAIVIEVLDHKDYDRKFGYSTS